MTRRIAVIVGSLRKGAYSAAVARHISKRIPGSETRVVAIGGLPLYNPDLEDGIDPPEPWAAFRREIEISEGVLFVTPEYNRSIPAAMKNALDVGSRPSERNVWGGKRVAVVSTSPGRIGGFGANHALRQCCVNLDMRVMGQPEAYFGDIAGAMDSDGNITDERTRATLERFATAFASWIEEGCRSPNMQKLIN
ncbi:MAG: NAD(P)H-dependent oxidoreductase [Candidatus Methanoplasma sp.]|jgi:chromate reductase|nr:NAD(P)H-dependent oxidoreductase [Candidatus Methanoplasma sp.]